MDKKTIVLWKGTRGLYSQDPPGQRVAVTISDAALKALAETHRVFVLELSEDEENIEVTKP